LIASVVIKGEELLLLSAKAVYWPSAKLLLAADLHLGKTTHFRKAGIAVPDQPATETLNRLKQTAELYDAEQIVIIGDLFHSDPNAEWQLFSEWHAKLNIPIKLITGNHDKLLFASQPQTDTELCGDELIVPPFVFQHHPNETEDNRSYYRIAGHIHPGYSLRGKARQRLILPCFCVEEHQIILPAFGSFTGKEIIEPKAEARYFVIAGNTVTEVPQV